MRSKRMMRTPRPLNVAAGTLLLTVPTAAVALAVGQADAQSAIQLSASPRVGFDQREVVHGTAPVNTAGQTVELQFARAGSPTWHTLGSTKVRSGGHFRYVTRLRTSGSLRATLPSNAPVAATAVAPSGPTPVVVRPEFRFSKHSIDALQGQSVTVRGKLLPGLSGRTVRLQGHTRGGWRTLGSARTGSRGGFHFRFRPGSVADRAGGQKLRILFRGDTLNAASTKPAGRVIAFQQSVASWYDDAGTTACGFHAGLGVANKSLPCGTKVTFHYGGSTVTAVVDDRGPYVGGREWDLNQNTAAALGFGGVGEVWSTS